MAADRFERSGALKSSANSLKQRDAGVPDVQRRQILTLSASCPAIRLSREPGREAV